MRRAAFTACLVVAATAALGVGVWLGETGRVPGVSRPVAPAGAPAGPIVYYQDPDGKPVYAAKPANTADGRPFRAVRESQDVSFNDKPVTAATQAKRILYYRNPMGLPDVSKEPRKDSMGMDYIPVYEGEEDDGNTVKISPAKIQRSGVRTLTARMQKMAIPVRAPGTIQLDERRISVISLRAEAFIDRVENVTTGSVVKKGQPLFRLYSPAIASAAAEYLALLQSPSAPATPKGTRQRLLNLAVPPTLLTEVERTREVPITFTWTAPRDGIVLERNISDGMRVMPGDVVFRIADISSVWAMVDVPERDLGSIAKGQSVMVKVRSFPGRTFAGEVVLIYPQINAATRTARVRVELANDDLSLRPDMYADAVIDAGDAAPVLSVPEDAVIDSGDKTVVIVDKGEGRFEPREVQIGRRGGGFAQIREGIAEGDAVVVRANFLIDAESNLKAALKGLSDEKTPQ